MNISDILKNSKLCFGPMSKNIVDVIIDVSNERKIPFTFIPSRRQIEYYGGYVNNWTTKDFSEYVKNRSQYIAIQRDHGGPGQGSVEDDGYTSLEEDCKYFDSIHLDPWKKYPKYEDGLKWTLDMINFCYQKNNDLYFEVGTEEAIRKFSVKEIENFLEDLQNKLDEKIFERIIFCVIQSGTSLKNGINTGEYSSIKLNSMTEIVKKYNLLSKEHNGDFMDRDIMKSRFENALDSLNIAPELGIEETKIILSNIKTEDIDKFFKICYESGKWKKWVSDDFKPEENKKKLIEICGHYVFSNDKFKEILDGNRISSDSIKKELKIYSNNNLLSTYQH